MSDHRIETVGVGRVPAEPGSREPSPAVSAASGFDPSRAWPLQGRHQRLPKWARLELSRGICAEINEGMAPDVREAAKHAFGGNCTFSDEDMSMLVHFACWAIDQGYRSGITNPGTLANIDAAKALRDSDRSGEADKTHSGLAAGESADPKGIAQPLSTPSNGEPA